MTKLDARQAVDTALDQARVCDRMRDPQTYAILGAAMEVHRVLGTGFLEAVYHDAFAIELRRRGIEFQRGQVLTVRYKDELLSSWYRADFVCCRGVIVELKSVKALTNIARAQVLNYLRQPMSARC